MPSCPAIGCDGHMVARKSRFGKTFYSCSNFPNCNVIANDLGQLEEKYVDHPKTPYVKKEKKGRGSKKSAKDKTGSEKKKGAIKKKTTKSSSKVKAEAKPKRSQPTFKLSEELSDIVGITELSRGESTKMLWDYIKEHQLQDPKDKRMILPDEKLEKLFGNKEPVNMFKLAAILTKHLKS